MLEWNVYISDVNDKRIKAHNIFNHCGFMEDCRKNARKNKEDIDLFAEQLRRDLMYWYWSKCEWEIILSHWPPRQDAREEKIDVYDQVRLNWNVFLDYVWANRKELVKRKKKDDGRAEGT